MTHNTDTVVGTVGGFLLSIMAIPPATAIISTIVLGAIGAITGFITTLICKKIYHYFKKKES